MPFNLLIALLAESWHTEYNQQLRRRREYGTATKRVLCDVAALLGCWTELLLLLPEQRRRIEQYVLWIQIPKLSFIQSLQCRKSKIKLKLAIICYENSLVFIFQCNTVTLRNWEGARAAYYLEVTANQKHSFNFRLFLLSCLHTKIKTFVLLGIGSLSLTQGGLNSTQPLSMPA